MIIFNKSVINVKDVLYETLMSLLILKPTLTCFIMDYIQTLDKYQVKIIPAEGGRL